MKKRVIGMFMVIAVVAAAAIFACGGKANPGGTICAKEAECAKNQNEEFSVSKCEEELLYDFEDADSIGCGDQWKAIYDCAGGLDCSAWEDMEKFDSECGGTVKDLSSCVKNAKGEGGDVGNSTGGDAG